MHLGKAELQLHRSCSNGCFALLRQFWVTASSQEKKKNPLCPSPPTLWALRIQGLRLLRGLSASSSAGQDRVPLVSFLLFCLSCKPCSQEPDWKGSWARGGAVAPQSLSLPSPVLFSCISPTSPSLTAGSPSLLPGIWGPTAPFLPPPGYHPRTSPSQPISCQLCLSLSALPDHSLSLPSPALHLLLKCSQRCFPVVSVPLPSSQLIFLPCQHPLSPQHSSSAQGSG